MSREKASASPPSTMLLMDPPPMESAMKVASAESGMEKKTASVARMLPRNIRIINEVRKSPMAPSCKRVSIAVFTKSDWSNTTRLISSFGMSTRRCTPCLMPFTTAMVLVSPPCFRTGR